MAINRWVGRASVVRSKINITFGTITAGQTFTLNVGGSTVSFTAVSITDGTQADYQSSVANGLLSAVSEIRASDASFRTIDVSVQFNGTAYFLQLLGESDGRPVSVSNGGTGSTTVTTVQAATGPHHFNNINNWSLGALPADGDEVWFADGDVDLLYELAQSAITPSAIRFFRNFTGNVGLPDRYNNSPEWLPRALRIGNAADEVAATEIIVADGDSGSGSSLIRLDLGDQVFNLRHRETNASSGMVMIAGSALTNSVYASGGTIQIGDDAAGYVTDVHTLNIPPAGQRNSTVTVRSTADTIIDNVDVRSGQLVLKKPPGAISIYDATVTIDGDGTVTSPLVIGGTLHYRASGTIAGNMVVSNGGMVDFSGSDDSLTVSNAIAVRGRGSKINDPMERISSLQVIVSDGSDFLIGLGQNATFTRS